MEQDKNQHLSEVQNYSKSNFERLFELINEVAKKKPEMVDSFLKNAEKLKDIEDTSTFLSGIGVIFDRLTKLTTPTRYANAPRKRLTPSSQKVEDYKLHVTNLIETDQIDVRLTYFFLSQLLNLDGDQLKRIKLIRDTIVQSPELDHINTEEAINLIRLKIAEIAKIIPQKDIYGRAKILREELPLYFSPPKAKHKVGYRSDLRVYINPSIYHKPSLVIETLQKALNQNESHGVFFEVNGLGRQDAITIYCCLEDLDDAVGPCALEKILTDFIINCQPSSLLINGGHPLGSPLSKGINIASEPPISLLVDLSHSLQQGNFEKLSNNMTNALMMVCAFVFAKIELNDQAEYADLKKKTESYYRQLQAISKINPDTLMSMDMNEGKIPAWAQKLNKKYLKTI